MARTLEQLQKQYNSSASQMKKGGGMPPPPGPGGRGRHPHGMGGKPKNTKQTIRRLLGYLSPYKFRLVLVVLTMLLSTVASLIGSFMLAPILNRIVDKPNTGALAMLGGLVLVPVVNLFTRKPPKDLVDGSFACYEKTVVVPQATALDGEAADD